MMIFPHFHLSFHIPSLALELWLNKAVHRNALNHDARAEHSDTLLDADEAAVGEDHA